MCPIFVSHLILPQKLLKITAKAPKKPEHYTSVPVQQPAQQQYSEPKPEPAVDQYDWEPQSEIIAEEEYEEQQEQTIRSISLALPLALALHTAITNPIPRMMVMGGAVMVTLVVMCAVCQVHDVPLCCCV